VLFSATKVEGYPVSDIMAQNFHSVEEFRAGWEGWFEGASLAQLRFDVETLSTWFDPGWSTLGQMLVFLVLILW
jgi:hypothetical protein